MWPEDEIGGDRQGVRHDRDGAFAVSGIRQVTPAPEVPGDGDGRTPSRQADHLTGPHLCRGREGDQVHGVRQVALLPARERVRHGGGDDPAVGARDQLRLGEPREIAANRGLRGGQGFRGVGDAEAPLLGDDPEQLLPALGTRHRAESGVPHGN